MRTAALAWVFALGLADPQLHWDARTLFERGTGEGIALSDDGKALVLAPGTLYEDDGPAAGYSYLPNEEKLSEKVRVRKDLIIDRAKARTATLLVAPGGDLEATINGKSATLSAPQKVGKYWQARTFDPALLRAGTNEIVLRGMGSLWIARDEDYARGSTTRTKHPNRSAKSVDGGASWDFDRVDGEYYVRVALDQPAARGRWRLPVIDLGNLDGKPMGAPVSSLGPVKVTLDADPGVTLRMRAGTTPIPSEKTWAPCANGAIPKGRYLEAELELAAPVRSFTVEPSATFAKDWTAVVEHRFPEFVRTSIPFQYDPYDHPRLKEFREKFGLDRVVEGAKNEMDLVLRLGAWTTARWQKGHLSQSYPAWDAQAILEKHSDGTPVGGFCQQYAVVFLQACESFGIPARAVSISQGTLPDAIPGSGHETTEVWSNPYGKWIYVDAQAGWMLVDEKLGVPLSLWELRERQLHAVRGEPHEAVKVVEFATTPLRWKGLTHWPPFIELRLIPRSDFLRAPAPLPLNQGMRGWFWTGHHVWTDAAAPASILYDRLVRRRGDFEWTLNQARLVLEAGAPGEITVHLETETPGFESFRAEIDGAAAVPLTTGYLWKLHPGRNSLRVRPRNIVGREGIAGAIVVEYSR